MPRPTSKAIDPWTALDAIVKLGHEPTGPEWFTASQFAERYNISIKMARTRCHKMNQKGQLKKWVGFSKSSRRVINKYSLA